MQELWSPARGDEPSLAVHGGAGARPSRLSDEEKVEYHRALARSLAAGREVLDGGGPALDAVCASVVVLEESPLFNAGHGAALNADGLAELDAAVMTGQGLAGAVIGSTITRNPVLAARAVMERTEHVALVDPSDALLRQWGLQVVARDHFVTEHRLAQVRALREKTLVGPRHGTVGAVARDRSGTLAAATSTGGIANQLPGRVGDAPVIGAGTWADSSTVAISCTGHGEHFMRQVVAHQVHSHMAIGAADLRSAVVSTMDELGRRGGSGGLIAIDSLGNALLVYNSEGMFSGFLENGEIRTHV